MQQRQPLVAQDRSQLTQVTGVQLHQVTCYLSLSLLVSGDGHAAAERSPGEHTGVAQDRHDAPGKSATYIDLTIARTRKATETNSVIFPHCVAWQDYLDNFKDRNEFWYVKRDSCSDSDEQRSDEKWWIPIVKVPPGGLSPASRGWLQHQKELVNQVLKAAMAINANCLMEMAIPESYLESLPKVRTGSSHDPSIHPPCKKTSVDNGKNVGGCRTGGRASATRCTGSSPTWSSTRTCSCRRWTLRRSTRSWTSRTGSRRR